MRQRSPASDFFEWSGLVHPHLARSQTPAIPPHGNGAGYYQASARQVKKLHACKTALCKENCVSYRYPILPAVAMLACQVPFSEANRTGLLVMNTYLHPSPASKDFQRHRWSQQAILLTQSCYDEHGTIPNVFRIRSFRLL